MSYAESCKVDSQRSLEELLAALNLSSPHPPQTGAPGPTTNSTGTDVYCFILNLLRLDANAPVDKTLLSSPGLMFFQHLK